MVHKRVIVIYKSLPQYRSRFFEAVREALAAVEIDFVLIYGQPGKPEASRKDTVELPWARGIENRILSLGKREIYWQPCLPLLRGADLVIVEQASKLLINYLLLLGQRLGLVKVAFWGHGKNYQMHRASKLGEFIKRLVSRHAHWWFAYSKGSAAVVEGLGFPDQRITVVQNAIDTRQLRAQWEGVREEDLAFLRGALKLEGEHVGIYVGAMYPDKRLAFLIEAAQGIRAELPDFELILIGSGPDAHLAAEAAKIFSWIRYVGPLFDAQKVPYFKLAKLLLMPGAVGLAILDSFALGVPMLTTDVPFHGPEIEYLEDGVNGVMVEDDVAFFTGAAVELLRNEASRRRLVQGCEASAPLYSNEEMARRFTGGILQALETVA